MSDPFSLLTPKSGTTAQGEVRQHTFSHSFQAWRQANIAYPDLYVCDKTYVVPEPLAEDGAPMTMERRRQLMHGKKPMYQAPEDGDNSKAKPTLEVYTFQFDNDITPEELGTSAIKNRPKIIRVFPPKQLKDKPNVKVEAEEKEPSQEA